MLIRNEAGEWSVKVFRALNEIVEAWTEAARRPVAGVLHVGFDRRNARSFETIAQEYPQRLLLTPGARGALPATFRSSTSPVGNVEDEPLFLALDGWGYSIEEPVGNAVTQKVQPRGWIRDFLDEHSDTEPALSASEISDDQSYLENEEGLNERLRTELGKFRFQYLLGTSKNDPTEIARSAPPWLMKRRFSDLDLTVRLDNVFRKNSIETVADLSRHSLDELFKFQNFGRTSCHDLSRILVSALDAGPLETREAILGAIENGSPISTQLGLENRSLIEAVEHCFSGLSHREADILKRRMGWDSPAQTLEEIGSDYGITRERIRQIEGKTVEKIIRQEVWDDLLGAKLKNLLSSRNYPLPLIGAAALDPWFSGLSDRGQAARYLVTRLCDAGGLGFEIEGVEYLTFLKDHDWTTCRSSAKEILANAVSKGWTRADCKYQVGLLLPEQSAEFRGILWDSCSRWCHFAGDEDEEVLISFGRGVEQLVEAVLHEAERPLHYSEIAKIAEGRSGKPIDERRVHSAAAEVGYLFGSGTYGTLHHMSADRSDWESFADEVSDIISEGERGRQWHTSELLQALVERRNRPSGHLRQIPARYCTEAHRRSPIVWKDGLVRPRQRRKRVARVEIHQAIVAIVKDAGSPLTTSELRQRLIAVRGINEGMQFHVNDPLIKLDARTWGLNDRDIELKRNEQKEFFEMVARTLDEKATTLSISEIASLSPKPVPNRAVRCLLYLDDRFQIDGSRNVSLSEWS